MADEHSDDHCVYCGRLWLKCVCRHKKFGGSTILTPSNRKRLEDAARLLERRLTRHQEQREELRALLNRLDAFLQELEDDPYAP